MERQLQDKIFISTRSANKSDELALLFANQGATLLEMPLIKILPAQITDKEKSQFVKLEKFQWLIFTSPNGVHYFFEILNELIGSHHLPEALKIAVIGNKTEQILNAFGYQASFKNPGFTGEEFVGSFIKELKGDSLKPNILLALGNIARTVIQDKLAEGATCTRINVYQTKNQECVEKKVFQQIEDDNYEMLLFTSPSGIKNFIKLSNNIQLNKIRMACIGETTAKEATKNNIIPKVIAKNSTATGLFESILDHYKK